jgi:DNA-directed RNA polymerase specialized sigma24 family protein
MLPVTRTIRARRRLVDLALSRVDDNLASLPGDADSEGELRRRELERALDLAVSELPAPDRLLLTLRFHDGLSGAEIASLLPFPSTFHVYRRLNHLLAELRRRLLRLGATCSVTRPRPWCSRRRPSLVQIAGPISVSSQQCAPSD